MRGHDSHLESITQFDKRMQKRNRIGTARKRNKNSRARPNRSALKRRRDRIGHTMWRLAPHQVRLFRVEDRINASSSSPLSRDFASPFLYCLSLYRERSTLVFERRVRDLSQFLRTIGCV